ncbi:MAG TPA: (Fe-S)-binding protein [Dehalococcoidales bacterium]|nr:(Fe-S)-binding protein [Dehalococcoidales bacterium]
MTDRKLIPPGMTFMADNVITKQNILGTDRKSRAKWAKDLNLPKTGETIFFAGCGYQYSAELENIMGLIQNIDKSAGAAELAMKAASLPKKLGIDAVGIFNKLKGKSSEADAAPLVDAVKVLRKLGIDLAYLGEDEPCCGGILEYAGLHDEFTDNGKQGFELLKSKGVKRIISIVPSCTYTLRNLIPANVPGYNLEVKHFSEVVAENISNLKLRFPKKVKVTYHDPCQMSRCLGLIQEPRKILNAIENVEVVEPAWTKGEWSTCCGGGGGFEAVFPGLSHILATNRAKELTDTGADVIVTNCPGCVSQLIAGLKELKKENVAVLDLAQIVAQSLEV